LHGGKECLSHQECASQIRGKHVVPRVESQRGDTLARHDAGVVHDGIGPRAHGGAHVIVKAQNILLRANVAHGLHTSAPFLGGQIVEKGLAAR